jgi:hypothetical protein
MGRPPKKARERKSRYLSFPIEKARVQAYKDAAAKGFKGNVADFLRAAADALAAQLGHPVKPPADEKPGH